MKMKQKPFLSSEHLKIIASATMLADHTGVLLFPQTQILRAVGRISMPIFAYLIAEGCRHTKSKEKYFIRLFALGAACQLIYIIFSGGFDNYLNILLTYAAAVGSIIAFERTAERLRISGIKNRFSSLISAFAVAIITACVFSAFDFSYGLWAAAMIYAAYFFDTDYLRLAAFSLFLILYCIYCTLLGYPIQFFSLLSLLLILLYNGEKGDNIPSWFWYLFYPGHIGILWLIKTFI